MKKIINKPETLVMEMCNGMVMAHPELELLKKYKVIKKKEMNENKVTLISGGGSGHEPAHAGLVGKGMLDAAVCGDVFASPSQIQVYQAIKETASKKGTLLIIKNYSGDIMNFKNGAHLAKEDGIEVDYVKVDDDIAVEDSLYTVGRRGVAGVILVHKIAGAAAEAGMDLGAVKAVAEKAAANVRTIGLALTSCTVPASGSPTFTLAEDEMEYGVGIHGEPGIKREKMLSADELANRMTNDLVKDLGVKDGEEIAILVNGFGGTPLQELYLFNNAVTRELAARNIKINRVFVGNYMTSIDMAGMSLTVMKLDEELKTLLSKECNTPAFKVDGPVESVEYVNVLEETEEKEVSFELETAEEHAVIKDNVITLNNMIYLVDKMSDIIIKNEVPFCELDTHAGDGDFGMSVAKGFKQLKREWHSIVEQENVTIGSFLDGCSMIIMEHCGGASGPIWGGAFRAASKAAAEKRELTVKEFAEMLQAALQGIQSIGERSFGRGAVVGDKTLVDALAPCVDSWLDSASNEVDVKTAFEKGAEAAVKGAEYTKEIVARMGRAGTVGERSLGYPDAGAHALGVIFTEIAGSLK
ncbi:MULTISPECIES: dihydroxyacetone kinase subunit DhaK [Bacillus]|uniref:phosphoenolpyruvate--glycerone phosphotransferase n=1 Tax=Bacillus cereus (strain ATCC 14579 / DSM 31 / CCUG 7414 / JCM 2152 / NBRC 15305 / NCIMB 9373 / NCTC 2599 / NRRL B-3711) TaxID=226900 RepID=Q81H44_BACCR|nr:dihydroxyacetone kinase subunit DhaK [Bacillus cereus]AAP07968.1 Dihydroxyacetone kinase [Bacillus cereus ATCC 14579]EEL12890.1 Dihydroxyacetone kinase [Bacillus cereus BDRD-Cer4]KZD85859.1 Dihydroxyacetone kinase ATP-dependent [Bacillus cereus]MCC3286532.1 dihydroxyacetone kinase subunit DhaK [Bacillus cereus]MEB9992789.1 dihydroxyacetone kinase subunit DhaK [Bacillus cereus]